MERTVEVVARHRWLYIPDLASPTGWVTHDSTHGEDDVPLADAVGFRYIDQAEDEDDDL